MRKILLTLLAILSFSSTAAAQTTTFVLPYGIGTATGIATMIVVEGMKKYLQGTLVVEPRPGAGGAIAMQHCAKAPADGSVVCIAGLDTLAQAPAAREKQLYRVSDFRPIGLMVSQPLLLAMRGDFPALSLSEFTDHAKSRELLYGSSGPGSGSHIAIEKLNFALGFKAKNVPFAVDGSSRVITELMASRLDYGAIYVSSAVGYKDDQRIRFLAILGPQVVTQFLTLPRLPQYPRDLGVQKLNLAYWSLPVVPSGTPNEVVRKLNGALVKTMTDRAVIAKLAASGVKTFDYTEMSLSYAKDFLARSIQEESDAIKRAGIVIPQ